ncbi:hypothetical protein [Rhodococcus daqingensis]|uniref:Uncharacterized protein n=1 Tax=Rhodococcus daqingensis TaxID=2479363 RepID=A0ABW2S3W8_9NOCA
MVAIATAVVAITATISTGLFTYNIGKEQIQGTNERSDREFLRSQRQTAYSAYMKAERDAHRKLYPISDLFDPNADITPSFDQTAGVADEFLAAMKSLADKSLELQLIASRPVIEANMAVAAEWDSIRTAIIDGMDRLQAGQYDGDTQSDAFVTQEEIERLAWAGFNFAAAARVDLGVPTG